MMFTASMPGMYVPLKDKRSITIITAFQNFLDKSGRQSNKIWIDQGSEFYNRSMKLWLYDHAIEMYSIQKKVKNMLMQKNLSEP